MCFLRPFLQMKKVKIPSYFVVDFCMCAWCKILHVRHGTVHSTRTTNRAQKIVILLIFNGSMTLNARIIVDIYILFL